MFDRYREPAGHEVGVAHHLFGSIDDAADDAALLEALDDGRVSQASLDVTHPEPLPAGHPYYSHPRVRLSPHTSVHTPQTRINLAAKFADNLSRFHQGAPLDDVVDLARG